MNLHSRDPIELEATLVVCSEHPDTIMRKIAEITFVDQYRLVPRAAKLIRDIYFDTTDRALGASLWALRVREIDALQWITLKGPAKPVDTGGVERVEVDLPWSVAALKKVLAELSARGLNPGEGVNAPALLPPRDSLHSLGFRSIQDRETRREVRDIFSSQGERVAEMALDTVAYHMSAGRILHEEIEIEAKSSSGSTVVGVILDYLMGEFGPHVRKWDFGKLATGLALERLLEKGRAPDLIASDRRLTPAAYDSLSLLLA